MESESADRYHAEAAALDGRLGPALIVSPHLDDAVFACADLLYRNPGATVVTVFAGTPEDERPPTDWDRLCGFAASAEAVTARKDEDQLALFLLEAEPLWLDFLDAQYGERPSVDAVADALGAAIHARAPDVVLFPLGLFHEDHRLASEACLQLCRKDPGWRWLVYADALYRSLSGFTAARLEELQAQGWALDALAPPPPTPAKRHAIACYASQLQALAAPGHVALETLYAPEQYWRIGARPLEP